ncbi:MAG: translation initiation factor IF-2 [Candidatus Peribacter sp.]|jgi:translation initiation factor IF-2|nr:translation initiation factor IF-2 [Candidatus Peribacter sp.]MBT4392778.1 translation initiation factor IF-2 [Candidatus Peribacter sp.]MBT4600605.1 translation initiation factor IF-2 [Candidatus Peribacter sp.]MBT5148726.1 translation initiation factor IF-2 [Candidatus Peribacter sp.]MBT5637679.1 translation initiation factor IF-2 [Candidatus Peribacter sp.]
MRLVQVAKALGMTGQQLRKELENVDFGVKPTDREIPDNLAQGVVRYVARKQGLDIDMEALFGPMDLSDESQDSSEKEEVVEEEKVEKVEKLEKKDAEVNVLRKLTLEGVSKDAIKKQQLKLDKSSGKKRTPAKKAVDQKPKEEATVHQEQIKKKDGVVMLPDQITVKEFAEKTGIQVPKVIQALMSNGVMANITQNIDYDTAAVIAVDMGVNVQKEESAATSEALFSRNLEDLLKDEPENLAPRAPIVAVMGHVDHGKTSILDVIREADVVKGEAGGITQHIGAYQIEHKSKGSDEVHKITFIDTPGHEAFTAMRARGAQVTDIVVLVVAADEGVKPTTIEAIDHAKDAGVQILVAINKMDKEGADPERVKGELAGHGLQAEDWGGKIPTIPCSAQTKMGIEEILDTLVLMGEEAAYKANVNRSGIATVVESHLDQSLGPLATMIINTGTLKVGEPFVCGEIYGKVRTMVNEHGEKLQEVGPSGAVRVSGLSALAEVGDILQAVPTEQRAKQLVDELKEEGALRKKRSFADLVSRLSEGKLKQLKVVLKADSQGSLDAIAEAISKKTTDEVTVKVIHSAIGSVTETDVMMASASDGIVVAFHAPVPAPSMRSADHEGVKVQEYDVIYALLDDIDALLQGLVVPEEDEKIMGHLEVKGVFMTKKMEQVIGGKVTDGILKRLTYRIQRGGEEVGTGRVTSLRKGDSDIKEAKEGTECGMRTDSSVLIEEGDVLEVFLKELKRKK